MTQKDRTHPSALQDYIAIARPDHWFKNVFLLPGMLAVLVLDPSTRQPENLLLVLLCVLTTCLIAASNYTLNELLDAGTDRFHPLKKHRPLAAQRIQPGAAWLQWLLLGMLGIALSGFISGVFALITATFWLMGILYNVPPIRTKELPFIDVLSESINNPLRFLLGWYCFRPLLYPPSSALLAYWMIGAFLMAAKRVAEYRTIGDPNLAAKYRHSFRYYSEELLIATMLAYASGFMLFLGVLITKYHVELILSVPLLLCYLMYYTNLTFKENSIVQTPEKLVRDKNIVLLSFTLLLTIVLLSLVHIPLLSHFLGLDHQLG